MVKEAEAGSNQTQGPCGSVKERLLCVCRVLGLMPSATVRELQQLPLKPNQSEQEVGGGGGQRLGVTEVDSEQVGAGGAGSPCRKGSAAGPA